MKTRGITVIYSTNEALSPVNESLFSAFGNSAVAHHINTDARKPVQLH